MTSIDAKGEAISAHGPPVLVVVDDRDSARKIVADLLRRRFGMDYEVLEASNPKAADAEFDRMHDSGKNVAVILAYEHMSTETGAEFLGKTRDVYPTARRLLLADYGDNRVLQSAARGSILGAIDRVGSVPSTETDEQFLATVGDLLAAWAVENGRIASRLTVVGQPGDATFQVVSEVLQRWNDQPISVLEVGTPEGDAFLAERGISGPMPVVALWDGSVLAGANIAKISDLVGAGADTRSTIYEVAVLGLGPAGFSAAVNAASEGLRTIMIEPSFGQASSSPMIRNYLGFPEGVSGAELMRRAWSQALMFGAAARIGRRAIDIHRRGDRNVVVLDDGSEVTTHVVLLAIGVEYRRIGVPSVDRLIGRGVFYGFSAGDAQAMSGADLAVVGGANSAVQAAAHLARHARSVHLIVRGSNLTDSASDYLIEQIHALPNVTVHLDSEVAEAKGKQQLRSIILRNRLSGETAEQPVAGLFILIGAMPRTDWLPEGLARDSQGFVLTGEDGPRPQGPEQFRLPYETTLPGVFALGDVRSGSIKRVAAAVGEGSAAVQQVIRYRARILADGADRQRAFGEPMPVGASHG